MKTKFVRSLLILLVLMGSARAELIPAERLTDWTVGTRVGVIGGIPTRTAISGDANANGITDSLEGINNTGTVDVSAAIQAAINAASAGQVVRLPAGSFRTDSVISLGPTFSGKTLRGAGMNATTILANSNVGMFVGSGSGFNYPPSPYIKVTAGLSKGSTSITVNGDHASYITTGSYILLMMKGDPAIPVVSVYNYDVETNQPMQKTLHKVTAKSGGVLTIFPPLHDDYGGGTLEVRVATQFSFATGIGVEDLTVDCTSYVGGPGGSFAAIEFWQCHESWLKNVKAIKPWNYAVFMTDSLNSEVRKCYIGDLKGSGSNGAGLLFTNWNCLIEDNIIVNAFPTIEVNGGSAGNVFLYNYGNGMSDTNHGPHNQYNLHEGNAWNYMMSDGYFGGESDLTIHRNYLWGSSGSVHMRRFSRRFSVVGNLIQMSALGNDGLPNMGNGDSTGTAQLSVGDAWRDYLMSGVLTTRTSDTVGIITLNSGRLYAPVAGTTQFIRLVWGTLKDQQQLSTVTASTGSGGAGSTATVGGGSGTPLPSVGTTIYIGPGAFYAGPGDLGSYQEIDLDVAATAIDKGNHFLTGGTTSSLGGDTDPNSLCGDSKALSESRGVVWGSLAWPPFNGASPSTADVQRIPAGYRFANAGADPPGSGTPALASATVPTSGTTIVLTFSTLIDFQSADLANFTLSLSGGAVTLSSASGSGTNTITCFLSRTVNAGETGTISYSQPGNGVEDTSGIDLPSFSGFTIINNSTVGATDPALNSAVIPTSGTSITLTFSSPVDFQLADLTNWSLSITGGAVSMTSVAGSGTTIIVCDLSRTVSSGQTGTISYTQPGNGVEGSTTGNDLTSFTGFTVVNNSTAGGPTPTPGSVTIDSVNVNNLRIGP